jgi:hypothetical protein
LHRPRCRSRLARMDAPIPPPRPDEATSPWPAAPPPLVDVPSRSGRKGVLVAAVVLVAVGAVSAVAYLSGSRGGGFPETVLGYERIHGGEADRVESAVGSIRLGEIEIRAALYGDAGEPRLLAATYGNYPPEASFDGIVQGAAAGAEASGGTVDEASLQTIEADGYRLGCLRGEGPGFLVPGGPIERGVLCVFQGEHTGVLITTHTTEPTLGLAEVRSFVEAYEATA